MQSSYLYTLVHDKIKNVNLPTSEGASQTRSSEGVTVLNNGQVKIYVTPISTDDIPMHLSLYSQS